MFDICIEYGVEVFFVESKCDDEEFIMVNICDVKFISFDY